MHRTSKQEKLIERFKTLPKDFTWEELVRLFGYFGFAIDNKGKTSGSRVRFVNEPDNMVYELHKPHPKNVIKEVALKRILLFLKDNNCIK
ncbi:MAG: type II toxin-antitoxin system HicA family toxin [Bacteroidales bacterium]|nr:type II toxin-antitoxin system HicA family toxin [Bacteroidales bacterium]